FKKEWGELGGYVNMVVVLKFGIMEEFIPVILALVAEDMEILLQLLVYMFCLAVGLWVVGSSGVELHSKQSVELPGELCHKLWSPVQDVGVGEAIKLPDIPPIQLCGAHGRAGGVSWNEVHSLAIQVYYHHDHIGVWLSHAPARLVVQGEVKVGKVEGLLGLSVVELLGHPEVFEVLVIGPDLKLMLHTFQEVLPLLEQLDDGQHLLVMDLVVPLHYIQALGVKGHQMPLSILQKLLQIEQQAGIVQEVLNEPLVEVCKTKEHLHFPLILGLLHHTCYLYWVHLCTSMQDDQAKVLDLDLFKLTLLWLEVELVLAELFQDKASDSMVYIQHFGVDEDVIEVHAYYAFHYEVLEDVVHHGLEGGQAVGETKEHNEQLEQSPVGLEGSLPLIFFLNVHVVVTPPDIQFSEVSHTPEVVDELGDEGERVTVLHHHSIEYPIVLY
ncbi:hypothetical protein C0989_005822, partial [Termitomyces sp. Mn162]